jgi:membrane-bound serine protease (ClpP class)
MKYRFIVVLLLALTAWAPAAGSAAAGPGPVYLMRLTGIISPGNADFLESVIRRANAKKAGCLIVLLDTPGGLAESMRQMVMAIYQSRIPVVVYVSPSGARAASAGVMITMAADVAAMAPGTHVGAAHPVNAGGGDLGKTMSEKVTNDMAAFAKSIAEKRGRNAAWAEKAVRESVSVTEKEALKKNIIDLVAGNTDDLIARINGRRIAGKGRIDLDPANRVWIAESLRTRILKVLSNPDIAYILIMIGLVGIYFELSHPGVILPGVIGSMALILAFYSFQTLPVNFTGVLLIILGLVFFILEMKIASYGLLSAAGIASLVLGSLMLFNRTDGEMGLSWRVILPTLSLVGGFFVVVAGVVFRSRLRSPVTGDAGLVGQIGIVKTPLTPKGRIQIHGELWFARCRTPVAAGRRVRVTAVDGLTLEVTPEEAVTDAPGVET